MAHGQSISSYILFVGGKVGLVEVVRRDAILELGSRGPEIIIIEF
jgi:hypothetical protein